MSYSPRVKHLAYKLDPVCWVSYSGKPPAFKRTMDKRRLEALERAAKIIGGYLGRTSVIGPARIFFKVISGPNPIWRDINNQTPTREDVRGLLRKILRFEGGKRAALDVLETKAEGAVHLRQVTDAQLEAVYNACLALIIKQREEHPMPTHERTLMPPMKIAMMLHFACTVQPFAPEAQRTSQAYTTFVRELLRDGMIERPTKAQQEAHPGWAYRATEKGRIYVEALKAVKLPVAVTPEWKVPV